MRPHRWTALAAIAVAALFLVAPALQVQANANALAHRGASNRGADRLLQVQFDDGALPWIVGDDRRFQNVQGVTAQGFLDAFKVTGRTDLLDDGHNGGARGTHTWLANYMEDDPDAFISSANVYFLAEFGVLTGDREDIELAREALDRALDRFDDGDGSNGGPAADLARGILEARKAQGHTNLGIWDVALFVRGAQDAGETETADALAEALATQTVVDPFDDTANWYEIGLAGLLFGLAEADLVAHGDLLGEARGALKAEQRVCFEDGDAATNGSFPVTFGGETFCGGLTGVQVSSYAVLGLTAVGELPAAYTACDFLASAQTVHTGAWTFGGTEIAEIDGEAVQALAQCVLPARNGATSYADEAVGAL